MSDHVRGRDAQLVDQLMIEQGGVDHVVDMLVSGRFAVARKMRGIDLEVLGQIFEERIDPRQAAGSVKKQERLPIRTELMQFDGELAAKQFMSGNHFALRTSD